MQNNLTSFKTIAKFILETENSSHVENSSYFPGQNDEKGGRKTRRGNRDGFSGFKDFFVQ